MAITIETVTPTVLPETGGTTIRVTGTDLLKVTKVTFNGVGVSAFNKLNNTMLEFGSPSFPAGVEENKSITVTLTDGTTPASKTTSFNIVDNNQTFTPKVYGQPENSLRVNAYHSGTVKTSATGEKAPWIQQVEIMELVDNDGDAVAMPTPIQAPEYTNESNTDGGGFGN